jgi:cytochrome c oxidase cbb3-type subunit 2
MRRLLLALSLVGWVAVIPAMGGDEGPPLGPVERLYQQDCAPCHGETGEGDGVLVYKLRTKPPDFTSGRYKLKSTAQGEPPLRADVFRSITQGIATTPMLPQAQLSEDEARLLADYLLSLIRRPRRDAAPELLHVANAPPRTDEAMLRGRGLYQQMECPRCHGDRGYGDGPSAYTQTDAQGRSIQPRDLSYRPRKTGDGVENLYRVFVTGLAGTPMPSFGDALAERDRWALAHYVDGLGVVEYERGPLQSIGEEAVGLEIATRAAAALAARGGIRPPAE